LNPADGSFLDDALLVEHFGIVAEGAQLLEHAGLVRFEVSSSGGVAHWSWTATRSGAAALRQDAVRELCAPLAPQPAAVMAAPAA
jgi:hypothetical protein